MRFILCDQILEIEQGKRILASKTVSQMDEYLTEHYGYSPVMPASMLLECLAQVGGWLVQTGYGFNLHLVIAIIEDTQIRREVRPGETLLLEAHLLRTHSYGVTMRGEVRVGEAVVATVGRMVYAHEEAPDMNFAKQRRAHFNYVSGGYPLPQS